MCRHLAYVGEPVALRALLLDPPHGLYVQSWAPRRQRHGAVNADGFGVGWYADGDPLPARYRRAGPIWAYECLADLARVTRGRAVLAAVRSASPGTDHGAAAAAPYHQDRWLFSHNGAVRGWSATAGPERAALTRLAEAMPAADLLGLEARCDSALIWVFVLARLRAGADLADALTGTIADFTAAGVGGLFNLLLTDGETIAATAAGDTLCYRTSPAGVVVASEPGDDEPGWQDVPDGSLLAASAATVTVRPLAGLANRERTNA